MSERLIQLRYTGTCSSCQKKLETGTNAWWSPEIKRITCANCHSRDNQGTESALKKGALARQERKRPTEQTVCGVGVGQPGGSAQAQFERLPIQREKRIEATWGKCLAPIVKRLSDDPKSTRAWASGARGEEWVGGSLERLVGDDTL